MGKIRFEVATAVREAFIAAEEAAENSAAATARCIAVLIEARARAKLPPVAGTEIIELVARSSQSSLDARRSILLAHPLLADLGQSLNVFSFGPDGGCEPNSPFTSATSPLRVVATAG